jgi:hypothetical protein
MPAPTTPSASKVVPSPQGKGHGGGPGDGGWTCKACGTANWASKLTCRQAACKQSKAEQTRFTRAGKVPKSDPKEKLALVSKVARAAREELITRGQTVELFAVISRICEHFKVSAWAEVGVGEFWQVEELRELQRTTQEVWLHMLVFCKSMVFSTMVDLERDICAHHRKNSYGELRLGPFRRHRFVRHYFSEALEASLGEGSELTQLDIIGVMMDFRSQQVKQRIYRMDSEPFFAYLMRCYNASDPRHLGVYCEDWSRVFISLPPTPPLPPLPEPQLCTFFHASTIRLVLYSVSIVPAFASSVSCTC